MYTKQFTVLFLSAALISIAPYQNGAAAVSMVDTFDQGGFSLSSPGGNPSDEIVNLPLGTSRYADLSRWLTSSGSTMKSNLNASTGTLTYATSGISLSFFPMSLTLVYSGATLHNITGCTEFILGFSELVGVGTLYVELGGSTGVEGVIRADLASPGEVHYPVSSVYEGAGHTLDSFNVLTFRFESRSAEFSFTLDEIRLVPEPSVAVMVLAAGAFCLGSRRRR
jgi:hypothetical protein